MMWTKRECRLLWTVAIILFLYPLFALEAKEVTMSEPVVTWNIFLTVFLVPLLVVLLGVFFGRRLDKQTKGFDLYHEEVKRNLNEWRTDVKSSLCDVKTTVENIERDMNTKVSVIACDKKSDDKWYKINHHSHDQRGKVVEE